MKKIGILGSGTVGRTLANGFIKHGYEVKVGTRDLSKLQEWNEQSGDSWSIGSFEEASSFGEILVLAVKGAVAKDVMNDVKGVADGKIVLDATNPVNDTRPPVNGVLHFFTGPNESLMESLQELLPKTRFVKCFSCIGAHLMVNPDIGGGHKPAMFIAGNDEEAKVEVSDIVDQFGFEVEDMGAAEAARAIEPLSMLWCIPGFRDNQWSHAFKLLR